MTRQNMKQDQPHIATPGIDVGTYDIDDIGRLSIWDAAGQVEYHVTHGMFLGSKNSVAVVVYNLKESNAYEVTSALMNALAKTNT